MVEGITTYEYVVREQRKQREREEARANNKQVGPSADHPPWGLDSHPLSPLSRCCGSPVLVTCSAPLLWLCLSGQARRVVASQEEEEEDEGWSHDCRLETGCSPAQVVPLALPEH